MIFMNFMNMLMQVISKTVLAVISSIASEIVLDFYHKHVH